MSRCVIRNTHVGTSTAREESKSVIGQFRVVPFRPQATLQNASRKGVRRSIGRDIAWELSSEVVWGGLRLNHDPDNHGTFLFVKRKCAKESQ